MYTMGFRFPMRKGEFPRSKAKTPISRSESEMPNSRKSAKRSFSNLKGQSANPKGQSRTLKGQSANPKGQSRILKGQSLGGQFRSGNSRLAVPLSKAKIGISRSQRVIGNRSRSRDYVVLIGDIVKSRKRSDRALVQRHLNHALQQLAKSSVVPPEITGGDEFKALFHSPDEALKFARAIEAKLPGVEFRFGVGHGALPNPRGALRIGYLDGPAFHAAREAIELAKKKRAPMAFRGFGDFDDLATEYMKLRASIMQSWTRKQREYLEEYQKAGNLQQAADHLGIALSTLHGAVQRSKFQTIQKMEEDILRLLTAKVSLP